MDWNADGLKDLLVGENNGQVRYFRNIGTVGNPSLTFVGLLQVGGETLDVGDYSTPWTDDWNGDSLIDLLVGASDGLVRLYLNVNTNANPVFNTTQILMLNGGERLDVGYRSGPGVFDLNGDGVKDLVSGEMNGKVYYFHNSGTNSNPQMDAGVFLMTGATELTTPGTSRSTPVDWNNDGDYDLVVGSYDARLKRYMQVPNTAPAPTCELTNLSGYLVPASGGRVTFTFAVNNASGSTVTYDGWTDVDLPGTSAGFYGPIFSRTAMTLGPGGSETRTLNQDVPGVAPTGYYYYYGYIGNLASQQVYSQDYIYFMKEGSHDGEMSLGDWSVSGWANEELTPPVLSMPTRVNLNASPNPFNPMTTMQFTLPAAERVTLSIYNFMGQKIATLVEGYRAAGTQQVTWDASGLPTGVYLAALHAGSVHLTQKVVLVK